MDVLSPLLFNLFVNDIVPLLQSTDSQPPVLQKQKVGSLLYADDLVVLSTTPDGLQCSLDKLASYCTQWKLQVNLKKTKIMCMSRNNDSTDHSFNLAGKALEQVEKYTYLGFEMSQTGSFAPAEKVMYEKALRALFKLKSLLRNSDISPALSLELFDQLIKPICMYGSELWGPDCLNMRKQDVDKLFSRFDKLNCEKIHLSFCRYILGVHRKAQISAVRGELGRTPLGIDVVANTMMYKKHLESKPSNSLLGEALSICKSNNSRYLSRAQSYKKIEQMTCEASGIQSIESRSRKGMTCIIKRLYSNYWSQKLKHERKMRMYKLVKSRLCLEDYLSIPNIKHRNALTRLRISAHNLPIERGRYLRPPTPVNERLCTKCNDGCIGDEFHFLMECSMLNNERQKLFDELYNMCPQICNLQVIDTFIYLLNASGNVIKSVAAFVHDNLP